MQMPSATSIALLVAAGLFLAFLVARIFLALGDRGPKLSPELKKRLRDLLATARREKSGAAWVAAGRVMLAEAHRPSRAAAIAWRAVRAAPTDDAPVVLLRDAWNAARAPRRLERDLWKVLDHTRSQADDSASRIAARKGLVELYEGPLHAPAKAESLKRSIVAKTAD